MATDTPAKLESTFTLAKETPLRATQNIPILDYDVVNKVLDKDEPSRKIVISVDENKEVSVVAFKEKNSTASKRKFSYTLGKTGSELKFEEAEIVTRNALVEFNQELKDSTEPVKLVITWIDREKPEPAMVEITIGYAKTEQAKAAEEAAAKAAKEAADKVAKDAADKVAKEAAAKAAKEAADKAAKDTTYKAEEAAKAAKKNT